jgi:hypothetical protein
VVIWFTFVTAPTTLLSGFQIIILYHCPFLVGKFSDSIALHLGKFASENQQSIIDNIFRGSLLLVLFWDL